MEKLPKEADNSFYQLLTLLKDFPAFDKILPQMISSYEKDDLIHIMKMNRFVLTEADSAHLLFGGRVGAHDYLVNILLIENQPQTRIEKDGTVIFNELIKSIDDLKIFLEERFYRFLEV